MLTQIRFLGQIPLLPFFQSSQSRRGYPNEHCQHYHCLGTRALYQTVHQPPTVCAIQGLLGRLASPEAGRARIALRDFPRLAILLSQQLIGFSITRKLFLLRIPGEFAAQLVGDDAQQARAGRAVHGFHVRVGLLARLEAVQEIQHVRVVLGRTSP